MVRRRTIPLQPSFDDFVAALGPGYGEFWADFEPILARIARSHSRNRGSSGAHTPRRSSTTVVPVPGTARQQLRPLLPLLARVMRRFLMGS